MELIQGTRNDVEQKKIEKELKSYDAIWPSSLWDWSKSKTYNILYKAPMFSDPEGINNETQGSHEKRD